MRTPPARKLLAYALGLIVLGSLWFYLAPSQLGGSTTYVVTHGISMEPRFHTGDLALVRSQSTYHVGEIVAYHSKVLNTIVLHRIIARNGSRYVFKGDNNDFVDPEDPAASQLIGALWVHVPGAGAILKSIASPALLGVLLAIGVFLLTGVQLTRGRRRRHSQRRGGESAPGVAGQPPLHTRAPTSGALALTPLALALAPLIVLALVVFTRATTATLPVSSAYKQSGVLSYSADTAPGPVYPSGRAVTGEPLFTNIIGEIEFQYSYRFQAGTAHTLTGKAQLEATVAAPSGWHTTFALGDPTHFHGDQAHAAGTLDLDSLIEMLRRVAAMTKVLSNSYTITIVGHVSATGQLDGLPLHAAFSPATQFTFAEHEIEPPRGAGGPTAGSSPSQPSSSTANTNPLASSASGSVTGGKQQARFLSFGPVRLSVATWRAIALVGIAIILCAMLAARALMPRRAPRDEAATIRSRYGRMIVPVARFSPLPGVSVIDVADIDALARIADHYDRSILQESTEAGDVFWVADESGQFRYTLGTRPVDVERPSPAPTVEWTAPGDATDRPGDAADRPGDATDTTEFNPVGDQLTSAVFPHAPGNANGRAQEAHTPAPLPVPVDGLAGEPRTEEFTAVGERLSAAYADQPNGSPAGEVHTPAPVPGPAYNTYPPAPVPGPAYDSYVAEPDDGLAEQVYDDELELGVIAYEPSAAGRPSR
jgi:signal peptidase I